MVLIVPIALCIGIYTIHASDIKTPIPYAISNNAPSKRNPRQPLITTSDGKQIAAIPLEESKQIEVIEKELDNDINDRELKKTISEAEDTEIDTSPDFKERLFKTMEKLSSGVIQFEIPHVGIAELTPVMDQYTNKIRLQFNVKKGDRTQLLIQPAVMDGMQLERWGEKLTGKLHKSDTVTIFGKKAAIRIRELYLAPSGTIISKISLQVKFIEPLKIHMGALGSFKITQGYINIKQGGEYPVIFVARTKDIPEDEKRPETRLLLLYKPGTLSAAVKIFNMPLKQLIPQVRNTILEHMEIVRGRVITDLWVRGYGNPDFPEYDNARRLRIEAELAKQVLPELPIDEEISSEDIANDMSSEFAEDIAQDIKETSAAFPPSTEPQPEQTLTTTGTQTLEQRAMAALPQDPTAKEADDLPDLPPFEPDQIAVDAFNSPLEPIKDAEILQISPSDATIDKTSIKEALPEAEPIDPEEPFEEPIIVCDDPLNDPCCRDPQEELFPTFSLQALLSSNDVSLTIGAQDIKIPKLGVLNNAYLSLTVGKTYEEREDLELRTDLKKKTLRAINGELSIEADCFPLKHIGNIENMSILLHLERAEKENALYKKTKGIIDITGKLRLKIPHLGKVPISINATLSNKGIYVRGKLDTCRKMAPAKQSITGRMEKSECIDRALSYAGFALENVQLIYGNLPLNAAEQAAREAVHQKRREQKEKAYEQRNATRVIKQAIAEGESPEAELLAAATAKETTPDEVAAYKQKKTLSLVGTFNLRGVRLIATMSLQSDPEQPNKKLWSFSAKGLLQNFRPFRYIPQTRNMAGLKDITFDEVSAEVRVGTIKGKPRPSFTLAGQALLFGLLLRANFKWVISKTGKPGVVIYTTPQKQQSLSDIIPILYGDFFKQITCCNGSFVFSSVDNVDMSYFTPEEQIELSFLRLSTIRKGATFVANIPFTGSLDKVGRWLGINKEQKETKPKTTASSQFPKNLCPTNQRMFRMSGNIDFANPRRSEFRVGILRTQLKNITNSNYQSEEQRKKRQEAADKAAKAKKPTALFDTKFSTTALNPFISSQFGSSSMQSMQPMFNPEKELEAKVNKPIIELDTIEIFIIGDPLLAAAGVAASIIFRPTSQEELYFKGSVEFSQKAVTIGAQMLGTWENAFTLQGWDLSDVALMLGFMYGSPLPTRLGGAGTLFIKHGSPLLPTKIGASILPDALGKSVERVQITSPEDFYISTKFMADANLVDLGFEGKVSRMITWYDLIEICLRATASQLSIDLSKVPSPLQLRNVEVRYAPQDIKIGDQFLEVGFGAKADFSLFGQKGKFDFHADFSGIKGFGTINKIDVENILQITSADGKSDPKIDIELSFYQQRFLITGRLALANFIESLTHIEVSASGFLFDFMSAIGKTVFEGKPLLFAQIQGKSSGGFDKPQFDIMVDFQQNLNQFIIKHATELLRTAEKTVEDALNTAQQEIGRIDTVIKKADIKINQAKKEVESAKKALKSIQKAREEARSKLQSARKNVDKIKQEIKDLDRWYNSLPAI